MLAGVLCLTLAACGAKQSSDMPASDTESAVSTALPEKAMNAKRVDENPYMAKSDANIHHDGYNTDSTDEVLPLGIYPEINVSYEKTNANASPAIYFDSYGHAVVPLLGGIAIRDLNAEETTTQGSAYRGFCIRCRHVGRLLRAAGRQCQANTPASRRVGTEHCNFFFFIDILHFCACCLGLVRCPFIQSRHSVLAGMLPRKPAPAGNSLPAAGRREGRNPSRCNMTTRNASLKRRRKMLQPIPSLHFPEWQD